MFTRELFKDLLFFFFFLNDDDAGPIFLRFCLFFSSFVTSGKDKFGAGASFSNQHNQSRAFLLSRAEGIHMDCALTFFYFIFFYKHASRPVGVLSVNELNM